MKADLVSAENDGDGLANTHDIPVPVGHVLVSHARSDVEHDDGTVALNVIACAQKEAIPQTGQDMGGRIRHDSTNEEEQEQEQEQKQEGLQRHRCTIRCKR
jgi:hypothetical protein